MNIHLLIRLINFWSWSFFCWWNHEEKYLYLTSFGLTLGMLSIFYCLFLQQLESQRNVWSFVYRLDEFVVLFCTCINFSKKKHGGIRDDKVETSCASKLLKAFCRVVIPVLTVWKKLRLSMLHDWLRKMLFDITISSLFLDFSKDNTEWSHEAIYFSL